MAAKKTPAAPAAKTCGCGCGESPRGKKARFLPGHDARFHAAQRAAGHKVEYVTPAAKRQAAAAATEARRAAALAEANARSDTALALQEADLAAKQTPESVAGLEAAGIPG